MNTQSVKAQIVGSYPCCGSTAKFNTYRLVPREVFSRQCPTCKKRWEVIRQTQIDTGELRVDRLDWDREEAV